MPKDSLGTTNKTYNTHRIKCDDEACKVHYKQVAYLENNKLCIRITNKEGQKMKYYYGPQYTSQNYIRDWLLLLESIVKKNTAAVFGAGARIGTETPIFDEICFIYLFSKAMAVTNIHCRFIEMKPVPEEEIGRIYPRIDKIDEYIQCVNCTHLSISMDLDN